MSQRTLENAQRLLSLQASFDAQRRSQQMKIIDDSSDSSLRQFSDMELDNAKKRLAIYERHLEMRSRPASPSKPSPSPSPEMFAPEEHALELIQEALALNLHQSEREAEGRTVVCNERLVEQEAKFEGLIRHLNNLLAGLRSENTDITAKCDQQALKASAKEAEYNSQIQASVTNHKEEINLLQTQSAIDRTNIESTHSSIVAKKNAALAQMQSNIDMLHKRLVDNQAESEETQIQLHKSILIRSSQDDIQRDEAQANAEEVRILRFDISEARQHILSFDTSIKSLETEKAELLSEINALKMSMVSLENEIKKLNEINQEKKQESDDARIHYEGKFASFELQIEAQGIVLTHLHLLEDRHISESVNDIQWLNDELNAAANRLTKQESECMKHQHLEQANIDLHARLDDTAVHLAQRDVMCDKLQSRIEQMSDASIHQRQLQMHNVELNAKLEMSAELLSKKETECDNITRALNEATIDVNANQSLRVTVNQLTAQLETSEQLFSTTSVAFDTERALYDQTTAILRSDYNQTLSDYTRSQDANAELSISYNMLENNSGTLRWEIEQIKGESAANALNLEAQHQAKVSELSASVCNAEKSLCLIEVEMDRANEQLVTLANAEADKLTLTAKIQQLDAEASAMMVEYEQSISSIQKSHTVHLFDHDVAINKLTIENAALENSHAQQTELLGTLRRQLDEQSDAFRDSEERAALKDYHHSLAVDNLAEENNELRTQTYAIENEYAVLQNQHEQIAVQVEVLESEAKQARLDQSETADTFEELRLEHTLAIDLLSAEKRAEEDRFELALTEQDDYIKLLQSQVKEATSELRDAQESVLINQDDVLDLKQRLVDSTELVGRIRNEASQAQAVNEYAIESIGLEHATKLHDLEAAKIEMAELKTTTKEALARLAELQEITQNKHQDQAETISLFKSAIATLESRECDLQASLTNATDEHRAHCQRMQESYDANDFERREEFARVAGEKDSQLAHSDAKIQRLTTDFEVNLEKISKKQDRIDDLDALVLAKDSEHVESVTSLMHQNDELRLQSYTLEDNIVAIQQEASGLKTKSVGDVAAIQTACDKLESLNADLANAVNTMTLERELLIEENQNLLLESDSIVTSFEATIAKMAADLDTARLESKDSAKISCELVVRTGQLLELRSVHDAVSAEMEAMAVALAELQDNHRSLDEQYITECETGARIRIIANDSMAAQEQSQTLIASLERDIATLNSHLASVDQSKYSSSSAQLSSLTSENEQLLLKLKTLDNDFRILAKMLRTNQSEQRTLDSSLSFASVTKRDNHSSIIRSLHREQSNEIQSLRDALMQITSYKPGNSFDHPLKRCQMQLEELRGVWRHEHEANEILRSLVYAAEGGEGCSYAALQKEFDSVVELLEDCIAERDQLRVEQ